MIRKENGIQYISFLVTILMGQEEEFYLWHAGRLQGEASLPSSKGGRNAGKWENMSSDSGYHQPQNCNSGAPRRKKSAEGRGCGG